MQPSWPTRNWYLFGLTLVHARDQHGRPSPLRRRCRPSAAIGFPAFAPARSRGLLRPELVIAWCLFWAPDPRRPLGGPPFTGFETPLDLSERRSSLHCDNYVYKFAIFTLYSPANGGGRNGARLDERDADG